VRRKGEADDMSWRAALLCHLLLRDEELSVAEVAKHMGTGHAIDLSAIHPRGTVSHHGSRKELLVTQSEKRQVAPLRQNPVG